MKAIWNMFTKTGFFHVNERKRRPKIMDDPDLGSHQFVQLSVSRGPPGSKLAITFVDKAGLEETVSLGALFHPLFTPGWRWGTWNHFSDSL